MRTNVPHIPGVLLAGLAANLLGPISYAGPKRFTPRTRMAPLDGHVTSARRSDRPPRGGGDVGTPRVPVSDLSLSRIVGLIRDPSRHPSAVGSADRRPRRRGPVGVPPPPGGTIRVPIPRAGALARGSLQALGIREPLGRGLGQAP